jgi:alpha-glucosidase
MNRNILLSFLFLISVSFAFGQPMKAKKMQLAAGEKVWAGIISEGNLMPFKENYEMDMYGNNKWNQLQPLILTNKGQYIWSEEPYKFKITNDEVIISDTFGTVFMGKYGNTLAEVQKYVREKYFPTKRIMPDELLFLKPQYNTWIELTYNQNQADIINYARSIIEKGLPSGVLTIDCTWQEDYGLWDFHPGRFPDPKSMITQLHEMGFKVMLWICPFVSADQPLIYNKLKNMKVFLLEKKNDNATWESSTEPAMIRWWDGASAELDFSNPDAVAWFDKQLQNLIDKYGVDGFKFDAGDMLFYPDNVISKQKITPNEHCRLYAEFGLKYPLNEYRACWKMGGNSLVQRLGDKEHSWNDLQKLIPQMVLQNLMGYTFSCPDMIGGGLYTTFLDDAKIDKDLIVRSAQCHALMTMMQFSLAPWRILDEEHFSAVKKVVDLRMKFTPIILELVKKSKETGEPIIKSLEYVFPNNGYSQINNQFMLGDKILVAPMLEKGKKSRQVILPEGVWTDDKGTIYNGGRIINIDVPLDRLPYFILNK